MLCKTLNKRVIHDFDELLWENLICLSLSRDSAQFLPDIIHEDFYDTYKVLNRPERQVYLKILAELDGCLPKSPNAKMTPTAYNVSLCKQQMDALDIPEAEKTTDLKRFSMLLSRAQQMESKLNPKTDKNEAFYKKRGVRILLLWQALAKGAGVPQKDIDGITRSILSRPSVHLTEMDLPPANRPFSGKTKLVVPKRGGRT